MTQEKDPQKLVKEVQDDFKERRKERSNLDSLWLLASNFYIGNQYATVTPSGSVEDYGRRYYWQRREVFNRIAPLVESRISKLTRVDTTVTVRPQNLDEKQQSNADFCTKLLTAVKDNTHFEQLVSDAIFYSEIMGTAFYKIGWNDTKGRLLGTFNDTKVYEGDVEITVCPPYEIYPDTLTAHDFDELTSVIHARAYPVREIEKMYGIKVESEDLTVLDSDVGTTDNSRFYGAVSGRIGQNAKKDHAVVIERYTCPTEDDPDGRLTIVVGSHLVFDGPLPYINGIDGKRTFPFVKQISLKNPASFFGTSIIDRLIPVQRAYNAVKNRKHEFLNRISSGIMTVESGSVNTDDLEEEGLAPGKIIVYRQGANPPQVVTYGSLPEEFFKEEESLEKEFSAISGISDFMSQKDLLDVNLSGTAINLLLEQDEARINISVVHLKDAVKKTLEHVIRLYRQFATFNRTIRVAGSTTPYEALTFSGDDLTSDDLVFSTDGAETSISAKRNMVMEIVKLGLMTEDDGTITEQHKQKILEALGFGTWQQLKSMEEIHREKAKKENEKLRTTPQPVSPLDDHQVHIDAHIRYGISMENTISPDALHRIEDHVEMHKTLLKKEKQHDETT